MASAHRFYIDFQANDLMSRPAPGCGEANQPEPIWLPRPDIENRHSCQLHLLDGHVRSIHRGLWRNLEAQWDAEHLVTAIRALGEKNWRQNARL